MTMNRCAGFGSETLPLGRTKRDASTSGNKERRRIIASTKRVDKAARCEIASFPFGQTGFVPANDRFFAPENNFCGDAIMRLYH